MIQITFTPIRTTSEGLIEVHVQRSTGSYTQMFTSSELEEEMRVTRLYCRFKQYSFVFDNTKWEEEEECNYL